MRLLFLARSFITFLLLSSTGIVKCLSILDPTISSRQQQQRPIPITVLSGFLGSGKTTLLQRLLNNDQGLRIAVIVNDVASVNIDSKLVAGGQQTGSTTSAGAAGMVELQNGCACCSLSEELLASVSELVTLSDLRGESLGFHHIVVELSGVADPKAVRAKFQEAVLYDMPLMERVRLDTMVTLVDCSVFLDQLKNAKSATPEEAPELFYREGDKKKSTEEPGDDDWTKDIPAPLLEALLAGERAYGSQTMGPESGVADLLVSQCETADIVLLNKIDIAEKSNVEHIREIVKALNPRATVVATEFGNVDFKRVLAVAGGKGCVEAGLVDDHKDAVKAASVARSHDHACTDPSCNDPSHSHDHLHSLGVEDNYQSTADHSDVSKTGSHSHAHSHGCDDPECSDPSHSHSHSHQSFGLGTFVYRKRRPFHPDRLVSFLRHLPISRGLPSDEAEVDEISSRKIDSQTQEVLGRVIRSKGFVWCADSDVAAMYWSHAGTSFDLSCVGRWWATLPRKDWPPEAVGAILEDFDSPEHNETAESRITVGDRRQEVVFIGTGLDDNTAQASIARALDCCLVTDEEWLQYRQKCRDERGLRATFPNPIEAKVLSY